MRAKELKMFTRICGSRLTVSALALSTAIGVVSPAWATMDNTVTVTGSSPGGANVTNNATEQVDLVDAVPGLTISKAASITTDADSDGEGDQGDVITYTYTVTNSGNTSATGVGVTDTHDGSAALGTPTFSSWTNNNGSSGATAGDATIDMLPGEIAVFTVTYTITGDDILNSGGTGVGATVDGDIDNSAIASGTYPDGDTNPAITSTASIAEVPLDIDPSLAITKVGTFGGVAVNGTSDNLAVGDVITYTYTVTNDGNVPVNAISLSDNHPGNGAFTQPDPDQTAAAILTDNGTTGDSTNVVGNGTWDTLAPGDVLTITVNYTVTQDDVDQFQ